MDLFERFEQLTSVMEAMNAEATKQADIPYIRLHDYVHYCDVKTFLHDYARRLRLNPAERESLLAFCFRDTLEIKSRIGERDLYAFTFHYFKSMVYRTGNLDTPDDCVEKLDMDRFGPYRAAREKQWRGETLTEEENHLLSDTEAAVQRAMRV